jgi:hypothetical protein
MELKKKKKMFNEEKPSNKKNQSKSVTDDRAYSEKILDLLKEADKMLESAPQNIEVRGGAIKLKLAIGFVSSAGKFAEIKKD